MHRTGRINICPKEFTENMNFAYINLIKIWILYDLFSGLAVYQMRIKIFKVNNQLF